MAQFEFKLETLLEHRRQLEDEAQRDLARHMRERMILQNQLRTMQQTIVAAKRDLAGDLIGRVDLDRVSQFARYSGQTTQRAQAIVHRMSALERQVDLARQKLLAATRDRRAIELLRNRQYEKWRDAQQRKEAVQLDELATQAYVRGQLQGVDA
jgi:flagellar FliJ protein